MAGPKILPMEKPESRRAKALLRESIELISATQPPEEGLVALPKIPFKSLAFEFSFQMKAFSKLHIIQLIQILKSV